MKTPFAAQLRALDQVMPLRVVGRVTGVAGLAIEASDLSLPIGTLCQIRLLGGSGCQAQVIGFDRNRTILMPLSDIAGVAAGDHVENSRGSGRIACGPRLLGRVIDGFGRPIDGLGPIDGGTSRSIEAEPQAAMERGLVREPVSTGVRAIDGLLTCGQGQRMGIFSGPGVGKSSLLAWICRHTSADVSVIALVGERGREVREFLETGLGPDGRKRCVVVVSTAEESPLMKIRAAKAACTVAEHFRDEGKTVLLLMDSLTRLCQAQRQIGLAAREPPATRGFPPSVFALLPDLIERAGNGSRGSITGFYTVLVEGDDFSEPIPDAVKSITDGHIWLSRELAERGHFPAIDVLRSVSRVREEVIDDQHLAAARSVQKLVADYEAIEDLLNIGAYVPGASSTADVAVKTRQAVLRFLQQSPRAATPIQTSRAQLLELVAEAETIRQGLIDPKPEKPTFGRPLGLMVR